MWLVQKEIKKVYMWKEPYTDYSAIQWPCPDGFHVPMPDEVTSIKTILTTFSVWHDKILMPMAWQRAWTATRIDGVGNYWYWWTCELASQYYAYDFSINWQYENIYVNNNEQQWRWNNIRPFKDIPVVPDSTRTVLHQWTWDAWIYHNSTLWLISLSTDWTTRITIADKNLWATSTDISSTDSYWYYYQWGNNYWFATTWSVTTSATPVDATWYWPWNYYNSSTFITASHWTYWYYWQSTLNQNLWWWETWPTTWWWDIQIRPEQAKPRTPNEHTYAWRPLTVDTTVNDMSWNWRTLSGSWWTYSTTAGVSSLYMGTASQYRVYSSFPNTTRENTFLVRVYISNKSYNRTLLNFSSTSQTISLNTTPQLTYNYKTWASSSTSKWVTLSNSLWIWTLVAITHSSNNATRTVYRINENETQKIEITNWYTGGLWTTWYIGNTSSANAWWRQWALSNIIVEDYAWTEEEIMNYYNTKKWDYWIS